MPTDAQFNIQTVLKPYIGFEAVYQGQTVSLGINLTPVIESKTNKGAPAFGGRGFDVDVGKVGFDPRLPAGKVVPMGARLFAWLPILFVGGDPADAYEYRFCWRLRSVGDFKEHRTPYHQPDTAPGVPNTFVPPPERFPLPVASNAIVYNQTEPASIASPAVQHLITEKIRVQGRVQDSAVLMPDGSVGGPQQGIKPALGAPPVPPGEMLASFAVYDTHCAGDELILLVSRQTTNGANWDFTPGGPDEDFSNYFGEGLKAGGYPKTGVYVFAGSSP